MLGLYTIYSLLISLYSSKSGRIYYLYGEKVVLVRRLQYMLGSAVVQLNYIYLSSHLR